MVIWKHATLFSAQEFGCETTSAEKRECKMKKAILALILAIGVSVGYTYEVGDVYMEWDDEAFSETGRVTVDDVEYLYTFKGIRNVQVVISEVSEQGFKTQTKGKFSEIQCVIEKAIPLTGNYDINISIDGLLGSLRNSAGEPFYRCESWDSSWGGNGLFATNIPYSSASTIVIGDSCFENNELIKSISIEHQAQYEIYDYERKEWVTIRDNRNLRIGNRSFYGATELNYVSVGTSLVNGDWESSSSLDFDSVHLVSVGESAFEGCENLRIVGFACDKLERIEQYAFKDCRNFFGIVSDFESLNNIQYVGNPWMVYECKWNTPILKYIGERAFWNAGISTYYIANPGVSPRLEWTFSEKEIEIGQSAFDNSRFLKEIHFPSDMEIISNGSFRSLNFESDFCAIYLPMSLITIETDAFSGANVQVAKWPSTLKTIGDSAFSGGWSSYNCGLTGEGHDKHPYHFSSMLDGELIIPESVERIGIGAFDCHTRLDKVVIQGGITNLSARMFWMCYSLGEVVLPPTVKTLGSDVFMDCTNLTVRIPESVKVVEKSEMSLKWGNPKHIIFEGLPPKGIKASRLLDAKEVWVPEEYKIQWAPYINGNVKFAKKVDGEWVALGGKVISNTMRASDPTIMDIKYKVASTRDKVNVRILAYKDGVRSFANALPLATFVDGTAANIGDGVAANVEHTVSWQVSKDWDADLAKISVEVFVMEDNLLPLQLTTIPANGDKAAVTFSRNEQSSEKIMNALYWLYADKTSDLTLENGVLKSGGKQLVNGTSLSTENALSYIYSKMGYGVLSGDTLKYVNDLMRSSISSGKFAVKEGAAE